MLTGKEPQCPVPSAAGIPDPTWSPAAMCCRDPASAKTEGPAQSRPESSSIRFPRSGEATSFPRSGGSWPEQRTTTQSVPQPPATRACAADSRRGRAESLDFSLQLGRGYFLLVRLVVIALVFGGFVISPVQHYADQHLVGEFHTRLARQIRGSRIGAHDHQNAVADFR